MSTLSLLSSADVQLALSAWLKSQRKAQKLSRAALAERSTVPAPTIRKFEETGQISLRQFLLLWHCVDDLQRLHALTRDRTLVNGPMPTTIAEVLAN